MGHVTVCTTRVEMSEMENVIPSCSLMFLEEVGTDFLGAMKMKSGVDGRGGDGMGTR